MDQLSAEVSQLKQELLSLDLKKKELASKAESAQRCIGEHATAIEAMKKSRDSKLAKIEELEVVCSLARGYHSFNLLFACLA